MGQEERIAEIAARVDANRRITIDDAATLWQYASDEALMKMAATVRARFHPPGRATYLVMRIINYTNVCVAQCDYCAFYVLPNQEGGYVLSREDVFAKIDDLLAKGGDLVGFNGGFNPKLPLHYYCDLFRAVRERYGESVEFYALTIAEFMYLADRANLSFIDAARQLREAGVYWITGGGSEILTEDFRKRHAKFKYTVREYFEAQRAIVESGMRTTATMVIGFDETLEERLEHLERTRDFQDECLRDGYDGLFSFLCWTYKPYGTAFGGTSLTIDLAASRLDQSDSGAATVQLTYPAGDSFPAILEVGPRDEVFERSGCLTMALAEAAESSCGALRVGHSLPMIRSMNKTFAPQLLYTSTAADGALLDPWHLHHRGHDAFLAVYLLIPQI